MNKTDAKTLAVVIKTGFTHAGDSHFSSYQQARRCLNRLVQAGALLAISNAFGTEYRLNPTWEA